MKQRVCQAIFVVAAALSLNIIGWPGPHGGLQCLYEGLWRMDTDLTFPIIQTIIAGFIVLGVIAAFIPSRRVRLSGAWTFVAGLLIFFLLLLTRIYPPVIPVVCITAIPFLGSLAGSLIFAYRPKCGGDVGTR